MSSQLSDDLPLDSMDCRVPFVGRPGLSFYSLATLEERFPHLREWPTVRRILLENLLRNEDGVVVTKALIEHFITALDGEGGPAIPFYPARVLMQDYAGISALVDFAGLRDELASKGADPATLGAAVPIDLVVDHSLQVIESSHAGAAGKNIRREYAQNRSRYEFLRWAEQSIAGLRIVPPGRGIVHQVNLEVLSTGVRAVRGNLFFDTVVGTDSHTPMVNGLGILGWGVGGIEALAVMLGQPVWLAAPRVIGVRLVGAAKPGVYAADIALNLTKWLRSVGVVNAFLEFHGPGAATLSVFDKTTIANMTPEYGATCSLFAIDKATLTYLAQGKRGNTPDESAAVLAAYLTAQNMSAVVSREIRFAETYEFDLSGIKPSFAGPSRPDQVHPIAELGAVFRGQQTKQAPSKSSSGLVDGSIAIAAITSCTNTANPRSMIAAGLVAARAIARGVSVPEHVKCSFTPGSLAVDRYLEALGLLGALQALGFGVAGYGCATCVGNSGELTPQIQRAIDEDGVAVAAVLSGNRNFESRIHPAVGSNFLLAPPLVVALAIAGRVDLNLETAPLAVDKAGQPVYLHELMPSVETVDGLFERLVTTGEVFASAEQMFASPPEWNALRATASPCFPWRTDDSYFRRPDFLSELLRPNLGDLTFPPLSPLLVLGDNITTDHISPVGRIGPDSEAGKLLLEEGETPDQFNTFGARRGNASVMVRGTFDNPRIRNELLQPPGPLTCTAESVVPVTIFSASRRILETGLGAIVIGGKNYGTGSARDWAAKGQRLLGVRAVIAESFERIHRANLIMLGVAPIALSERDIAALKTNVSSKSVFHLIEVHAGQQREHTIRITRQNDGRGETFEGRLVLDTEYEYRLLKRGGMLAAR